jgi:hypothetical protein
MEQKPDVALNIFTRWKWQACRFEDPEWREIYINVTYNLEKMYRERHGLIDNSPAESKG